MRKQVNPPTNILKSTSLLEKLRNKSKNKLDLKKKSGLEMLEKNLGNNYHTRIFNEKQVKLSDDYGSYKSESKINNLSKEIITRFTSEKEISKDKMTYNKTFNRILSPCEKLLKNQVCINKSININNIVSPRTKLAIRSELSTNLSVNNLNQNLNMSPTKVNKVSSDFTKFANQLKHKKGSKSISYQFNISSINRLKPKLPSNQTNINTSTNISINKDLDTKQSKEKMISHVEFHSSNPSENLFMGSNKSKSNNRISTEDSTGKSSSNIRKIDHISEVDSPEELHYFYIKLLRKNRNLAYKFENEEYDDKVDIGTFQF